LYKSWTLMGVFVKFFTVLVILFSFSSAFAQGLVNAHQHQVFEYATSNKEKKTVIVHSRINNQVPGHSSNYIQLEPYGKPTLSFEIPEAQFALEKKVSNSVFVATTGTGTSQGTAFLIGQNLVLTNKHVLANDKECRKFGIDLNHVKEFVPCKEVLHCSKTHDFCLIKLDKMNNGKEVGEEVKPLEFATAKPKKTDFTLIVGNAQGLGIQAATYQGVSEQGANWGHFNRAFSGNSGSPLLNAKGEVLGIHFGRGGAAESYGGPSDRLLGLAVKSTTMLSEIGNVLNREALKLISSEHCE
jgi:S1-C subfamily serine protease